MSPKEEAKAAIFTVMEMVKKPEPMTALERKLAVTTLDHALENLDKLAVARPRTVMP